MDRPDDLRPYLEPGVYVDSDHPAVVAFARREAEGANSPREIAVKLFYAVRDGIRYDPYNIDLGVEGMKASRCLATGHGFCATKAALLAAVLRVHGIATRLAFADVRNHMTSPRLQATMGTDVFAFHGNADIWLAGRWVKATPAFNLSLCQKAGTHPLEFDGVHDSILHPFDLSSAGTWNTCATAASLPTCRATAWSQPGTSSTQPTWSGSVTATRATSKPKSLASVERGGDGTAGHHAARPDRAVLRLLE